MPRYRLFPLAVGPDIVPATTTKKTPSTLRQFLFEISPLHPL
jgi:hypothetical protein